MLDERFHIAHTTVQFEHVSCAISEPAARSRYRGRATKAIVITTKTNLYGKQTLLAIDNFPISAGICLASSFMRSEHQGRGCLGEPGPGLARHCDGRRD